MPSQLNYNPLRAFDSDGNPAAGALATFFITATSTPLTVYTTAALDVAHPTPVEADAQGVFPPIWTDGSQAVKVIVTAADLTVLDGFPMDPVQLVSATGSAASAVSFSPVTGNAATNVQAAIENLTTFQNTALDLGVTSPFASAAQGAKADAAIPKLDISDDPTLGGGTPSSTKVTSENAVQDYVAATGSPPQFTSALTAVALGTKATIAHGLGAVPSNVEVMLRCKTADAPFGVGEEVEAPSFYDTSGQYFNCLISVNATNVLIRTGTDAIYLSNDTGTGRVAITPASWEYIVRAWK